MCCAESGIMCILRNETVCSLMGKMGKNVEAKGGMMMKKHFLHVSALKVLCHCPLSSRTFDVHLMPCIACSHTFTTEGKRDIFCFERERDVFFP